MLPRLQEPVLPRLQEPLPGRASAPLPEQIGAKDLVPENFNSAKRLLAMVQRLQDED